MDFTKFYASNQNTDYCPMDSNPTAVLDLSGCIHYAPDFSTSYSASRILNGFDEIMCNLDTDDDQLVYILDLLTKAKDVGVTILNEIKEWAHYNYVTVI